jgi:hypothetical protein
MTPPPVKGVRGRTTLCPPLKICLCCPLVKRKNNLWRWPAADSPLQLPSLHHRGGGGNQTKTSSGACEVAGFAKCWQNQQHACCYRNLCESTHRIELIEEDGTHWYVKQQG